MPDAGELIHVQRIGAVAVIRLDRPPVNAINAAMHAPLAEAARQVSADPEVRSVVLYGGERAFAAGAAIGEMAGSRRSRQSAALRSAGAANWRWQPTSGWSPTMRGLACRRSRWA